MMGTSKRSFAPLVKVCLEDLVPADHFYRHLERTLDLSFVREFVQKSYADAGRPSIDPVVFFKLQLVLFFEGIRSERQLMRHAADRLSVRWYLGYDLGEPLPNHSSLTRIRTRYGVEVFRRFFEAIVDQCQQAGLVWGKELYADATKVQANAALSSMKPRFAVEAHLAALFAQELNEYEEANQAALQDGNGVDQEVADRRIDSPASCMPSTTPEGVNERVEPPPPHQLSPTLDEALHEELTQLNSERHD
jgi:transposase